MSNILQTSVIGSSLNSSFESLFNTGCTKSYVASVYTSTQSIAESHKKKQEKLESEEIVVTHAKKT